MKVTPVKRNFGKYKPGDVFEMPDRSARVFVRAKQLREVTDVAPAPVAIPEPLTVELVAEEPAALENEAEGYPTEAPHDVIIDTTKINSADVEISSRTGRPKRTYRRRDMTAEG